MTDRADAMPAERKPTAERKATAERKPTAERRATAERRTSAESGVDATLIDWFLSLTPERRLAELESRIAFFQQARPSE